MPWNKINLSHQDIAKRFASGEPTGNIAEFFGVSGGVVFRHLREHFGDDYRAVVKKHLALAAEGKADVWAGRRKRGGSRWFSAHEEAAIVTDYRSNPATYQQLANKFGCSVIVIKRLLARNVPLEERKKLSLRGRDGRRLVEYDQFTCLFCGNLFALPPWRTKGTKREFCNRRCKGKYLSGERSCMFGKITHAIGRWYEINGRRHWFRSQWEYGFARYLDDLGVAWEYEKNTFPILVNGIKTTYTPDFFLTDFKKYVEVKGYWRDKYIEKAQAFAAAYPDVVIEVWDKEKLIQHGIVNKKGYLTLGL